MMRAPHFQALAFCRLRNPSPPIAGTEFASSGGMDDVSHLPDLAPPPTAEGVHRPLIRLSGVSKAYTNGTLALSDVELSIGSGEFLSLLGPSGCGKSTLLRLIAGLGTSSAGTIDWPLATYDARGEP